ncbi:MAG: hypothetical protein CBC35_09525 [Planctomycetes bacterium TMED75]|nr:asparaginase [Planctomycetaceae bacterium]OUU91446.1 MAG: hypothetical protein CBC35_09525 [Planctomycetes bacterium TMED75]
MSSTNDSGPFKLAILSTGGTIEKTYCSRDGSLLNQRSVLDLLLADLELPGLEIHRSSVSNMDSLDMTQSDHQGIVNAVCEVLVGSDGVVVVHGTDRLAITGELLHEHMVAAGGWPIPVVLTGAMRPYELRASDALQNMTEAILAVQLLAPGIFCVLHSKILAFPGVVKDPELETFKSAGSPAG